jgi:hypothetical protein
VRLHAMAWVSIGSGLFGFRDFRCDGTHVEGIVVD